MIGHRVLVNPVAAHDGRGGRTERLRHTDQYKNIGFPRTWRTFGR